MAVTKIDQTFFEETGNRLSSVSYLKLFNMLQDSDNTKYLNIWKSFTLNEDVTDDTVFYETYEVSNDDWWDNIAYYYYESPGLWWIIAMMNDIVNPFEELEPGSNIKILKDRYLYQLIKEMESISEL
jgi:hypothetical protein